MRNRALWPDGTVRWLSGAGRIVLGDHGILKPGIAFLNKPFTPASLGEKLREVLAG